MSIVYQQKSIKYQHIIHYLSFISNWFNYNLHTCTTLQLSLIHIYSPYSQFLFLFPISYSSRLTESRRTKRVLTFNSIILICLSSSSMAQNNAWVNQSISVKVGILVYVIDSPKNRRAEGKIVRCQKMIKRWQKSM